MPDNTDWCQQFRNPTDLFYIAKYDEHGNVRPGWNYKEWVTWWWENVPKTSTRECHTATHK